MSRLNMCVVLLLRLIGCAVEDTGFMNRRTRWLTLDGVLERILSVLKDNDRSADYKCEVMRKQKDDMLS